jgi:MFS family permease
VTALYAVAFLSSLGFSIVLPFMVPVVLAHGGNAFVVGVIGALFWMAQLVGSTWLGMLSDRIGRKRVLFRSQLGAMAAWFVFLAALSVADTEFVRVDERAVVGTFVVTLPLVLIVLSRVTDGLFNGSISVASAYVADVRDGERRRACYARLGAASSFGFVVGPLLAGFIARAGMGIETVVVLALALSVTAAVLIRFRLPTLPPRPGAAVELVRWGGVRAHKLLGGGCPEAVRHPRWRVRAILAIPELRPLIALYFLVYLGFSMFAAALPMHAIVDLGWSAQSLAFVYTALALALGCTEAFMLPPIARRVIAPVIASGGCSILVVAYLLMSSSNAAALLAGAVLYGVGNGLMWPSYLTMLSHGGPPEAQGAVQGLGSSTGSFASIIGTVAGGILFVAAGIMTFYVSAAAVAIATGIFVANAGAAIKRRSPSAVMG